MDSILELVTLGLMNKNRKLINKAKKLKEGMTKEDVLSIMGKPGSIDGEKYFWHPANMVLEGNTVGDVEVVFKDNIVQTIIKKNRVKL